MLTRIEIDGFKSFEKFSMDIGTFQVILGQNATGKSNLFDAIRLLSQLAGNDLRTAIKELRGEPYELFRMHANGKPGLKMVFAVEMLLESRVSDPWGQEVEISHTRVRYEVEIERRVDPKGIERLVISKEAALPILARDDKWLTNRKLSKRFKEQFMKYGRRKEWLNTNEDAGKRSFAISQDGRAGRTRSAEAAEATVLSSITSAEYPHLYAIREEMRSWRFLQLDPVVLRRPSSFTAQEVLDPDGANLATVLARIQSETSSEKWPKGVLADIQADLASLIVGVVGLSVTKDERNREFQIDISMRDGAVFSSRVASDGTLRVLALLTLLHDPKHHGLVCFEEPENGIHPFRLKAVIKRLRELVTDIADEEIEEGDQLSQILLNSHSPVVLSCLEDNESMFADVVSIKEQDTGDMNRKTRLRKVKTQGELLPQENQTCVSVYEVKNYLSSAEKVG